MNRLTQEERYPFYVAHLNFGSSQLSSYNVMSYFMRVYRAARKRKGRRRVELKSVEEVKKFIATEGMYAFWSKCEHELLIGNSKGVALTKIDTWSQIKLNLNYVCNQFIRAARLVDKVGLLPEDSYYIPDMMLLEYLPSYQQIKSVEHIDVKKLCRDRGMSFAEESARKQSYVILPWPTGTKDSEIEVSGTFFLELNKPIIFSDEDYKEEYKYSKRPVPYMKRKVGDTIIICDVSGLIGGNKNILSTAEILQVYNTSADCGLLLKIDSMCVVHFVYVPEEDYSTMYTVNMYGRTVILFPDEHVALTYLESIKNNISNFISC